MAFFDKLSKSVSKAADQAKFETDKMMRIRALDNEQNQLANEIQKALAAIGEKVVELRVPEFDEMIGQVEGLKSQLTAKKAELEATRARKFEDTRAEGQPSPAPAAPTPATPGPATSPEEQAAAPATAPSTPTVRHCPECGAAVLPGAAFCGECGHKMTTPEA